VDTTFGDEPVRHVIAHALRARATALTNARSAMVLVLAFLWTAPK
jgi:hypothetical protein